MMKKLFLILSMFPIKLDISPALISWQHTDPLNRIMDAMTWVESRGNNLARGSNQDRGKLQITPILLQHYNRSTGESYDTSDLFNPFVTEKIFRWHAFNHGLRFEEIARTWNGGPRGMTKPHTKQYWYKVRSYLLIN